MRLFFSVVLWLVGAVAAQALDGAPCGGIAGLECKKGEFCRFSPQQSCGVADQIGQCVQVPTICTKEFRPVCGCDGVTYGNECEASANGTSVVHAGVCGEATDIFRKEWLEKPAFKAVAGGGGACIQVIVCGYKDGEIKEYPTPCAAAEDGATNVSPRVGDTCPVLQ